MLFIPDRTGWLTRLARSAEQVRQTQLDDKPFSIGGGLSHYFYWIRDQQDIFF
jgi:hypothetical protein